MKILLLEKYRRRNFGRKGKPQVIRRRNLKPVPEAVNSLLTFLFGEGGTGFRLKLETNGLPTTRERKRKEKASLKVALSLAFMIIRLRRPRRLEAFRGREITKRPPLLSPPKKECLKAFPQLVSKMFHPVFYFVEFHTWRKCFLSFGAAAISDSGQTRQELASQIRPSDQSRQSI